MSDPTTTPAVPTPAAPGPPGPPDLATVLLENAAVRKELAALQASLAKEIASANTPSRASVAALDTKKGLKKFFASVAAAVSTPTAVKAEKSVAVVVITRLALYAPSVAVYLDLIAKALGHGVTP